MKEVALDIDNYTKCVCPVCPVQAASECVAAKRPAWKRMRMVVGDILSEYPAHPEAYDMEMATLETTEVAGKHGFKKPDAAEMLELYCSKAVNGASCHDLDGDRPCQCPTCAVWASHQLDSTYYCLSR
jgi:hypothetical protein